MLALAAISYYLAVELFESMLSFMWLCASIDELLFIHAVLMPHCFLENRQLECFCSYARLGCPWLWVMTHETSVFVALPKILCS
jgi:hypothetical protein